MSDRPVVGGSSRAETLAAGLVFVVGVAWACLPSAAQIPMGPPSEMLLRGARIHTVSGEVIENGEILISGSKIKAVGRDLLGAGGTSRPANAPKPRVLDLTGKDVIPVLIDASSVTGLAGATGNRVAPSHSVLDRIDLFSREPFLDALEQGVGYAYFGHAARAGTLGGRGFLMSLSATARDDASQVAVDGTETLHVTIGGGASGPVTRLLELERFKAELKAARKYEEDWDKYKEDLEKYEKELLERAKKGGSADSRPAAGAAEESKPAAGPPVIPNIPRPGPRPRPRRSPEDEDHEGEVSKVNLDPTAYGRGCPVCGAEAHAEQVHKLGFSFTEFEAAMLEDEPKDEPAAGATAQSKPAGKPQEPAFDADKVQVLRAINGQIALRVEVNWAEDIIGVLGVLEGFPALRVTLEGLAEGHMVVDAVKKSGHPVIVGGGPVTPEQEPSAVGGGRDGPALPFPFPGEFPPGFPVPVAAAGGPAMEVRHDNATVMARAKIPPALASACRPNVVTPRLLDLAAYCAGEGLGRQAALEAITLRAAAALGLSDKLGSIEGGKLASLVVLSGAPFAPMTQVEQVFIEGRRVYNK